MRPQSINTQSIFSGLKGANRPSSTKGALRYLGCGSQDGLVSPFLLFRIGLPPSNNKLSINKYERPTTNKTMSAL